MIERCLAHLRVTDDDDDDDPSSVDDETMDTGEPLEEFFDNADFARHLLEETRELDEDEDEGEGQQRTQQEQGVGADVRTDEGVLMPSVARVSVCAADNPSVVKLVVCNPSHGIAAFLKLAKQKLALRWNPLVAYHLRTSAVLRDTHSLPAESSDPIVVAKKPPRQPSTATPPKPGPHRREHTAHEESQAQPTAPHATVARIREQYQRRGQDHRDAALRREEEVREIEVCTCLLPS